jgi:ubiquinone/menaquinone biosynthesis C-methylase UbiE
VDREAVQWCRENISKATFAVNGPLPPLSYPDATFDFVHRISVFTHLSEQFQFAWIPELHRVLKPDGLLLLTSYSEHLWRRREDAAAVERKGCVFRTSTKLQGIVPEWYHTAFQSREHLMKILKNRKFTSPK